MNTSYNSGSNDRQIPDMELAHQQAVKYGQDMVEIYKQERAKREALEIAYKKLEGALESMSDGFLVVDRELVITEINQACADLFQVKWEDALNKPLSSLLVSEEAELFCSQLQTMERRKTRRQFEIIMPIARSLSIHAAPLPDEGWALVLHDITWEERVNNMREEFLNLAAHELRTPLAGIIGFASLLEQSLTKEDLSEDSWFFIGKILKSGERLRDTINDLLDFTISDSTNVEPGPVDLRETVEDALKLLNKQADENNIAIKVNLPREPMTVFGEQKALSSAVGHLIENAIRYNKPNGSLDIFGQITDTAYKLVFTDTGVGITKKDLEYIFRPFFQVEEHTTRRSVGMGLGLSIVQRTVTMHQGSLKVASEPNEGSVFTVILPRFSAKNMDQAKSQWLKVQRNLRSRTKKPNVDEQTQTLINQLKTQLEITQSQSVAYAKDLAKLYQLQRADAETMKAQEAKLTHTDRLALMGQMAAGVAHDLSNLLSPILGYSQVILRNRDAIDPSLVDIIERILSTSRRANILLRQMVNLSGLHSDEQEEVDLNALVREMLLLLEIKISHANVELVEAYTEDLPPVLGIPIQLSQVILNVLINALDAMSDGGLLTISTDVVSAVGSNWVKLQIIDTGEGIAGKDLPHIFEAFYTTKQERSGTGLGLSISRDIIENHDGQIKAESTLGQGTVFTVLLPILSEGEAPH